MGKEAFRSVNEETGRYLREDMAARWRGGGKKRERGVGDGEEGKGDGGEAGMWGTGEPERGGGQSRSWVTSPKKERRDGVKMGSHERSLDGQKGRREDKAHRDKGPNGCVCQGRACRGGERHGR